jgi:hypothetical protein
MENRHGLMVDAMLTQADGTAERDAALVMLYRKWRNRRQRGLRGPMSVGADKAYDTRDFAEKGREMEIRPYEIEVTAKMRSDGLEGRQRTFVWSRLDCSTA